MSIKDKVETMKSIVAFAVTKAEEERKPTLFPLTHTQFKPTGSEPKRVCLDLEQKVV